MFWRKPNGYDQFFVLFNDWTWQMVKRSPFDEEHDPEFPCPGARPANESTPMPIRGFAGIWCNTPGVRDRLGNATDREIGYTGSMQEFEQGFMLQTANGTIHAFYYDDGHQDKGNWGYP